MPWRSASEQTGEARALSVPPSVLPRRRRASRGPAQEDPIRITFSHFLGPDSFFQKDVVEPFARELEERTGGRVEVVTRASDSAFGDVRNQARQVADGTVDIALGLRGAEGDRFPATSVIELPFLVPDAKAGSLALWNLHQSGGLGDEYDGFKVLALFVHDPGLVHTNGRVVRVPEDMKGLSLRSPNRTVSAALEHLGAVPVVLQVDEVMNAVRDGRINGIVTNWGNPLQGFNDAMKTHTDLRFYTSAFFIVMNRDRYESLPEDVRAAIDAMSGEALTARLGELWATWAAPVRAGAGGPGHTITTPDDATMAAWREALAPVTDRYLEDLSAGFPGAREAYAAVRDALGE